MLNIRVANTDDRDYFINSYINEYENDRDLGEKYAIECIRVHRTIVLHNDDEIIGSVTWAIREGIKSGLVEIYRMSIVKQENRRKGYGNMLVNHCIKDIETFYGFRGCDLHRIFIVINEGNLAGRNLYKNNGFKVLTELKDHIEKGTKELVYVKDYF